MKLRKRRAAHEIGANMPPVDGIYFEIHGSELKLSPSEIAGQPAKICKPHIILCIGEHTLDGSFASVAKLSEFRLDT